jgi:hypothetical protein
MTFIKAILNGKLLAATATFATLSAATFSILTAPAYARYPFVYVMKSHCTIYNNAGNKVGTLNKGYYPRVSSGQFNGGGYFTRVLLEDQSKANGEGTANVPTSCLSNNGQTVSHY